MDIRIGFFFFFYIYIKSHLAYFMLGPSRSSTPSTLACDPATCPIIPGCETTIDISKGRTGLGLSIVGGCDTLLVRGKEKTNKQKSAYAVVACY